MYNFFYKKTSEELGGINSRKTDTVKLDNHLQQINIKLPDYIFELLSKHGGEYFYQDVQITNIESVPITSSGKIGIGEFMDISIMIL